MARPKRFKKQPLKTIGRHHDDELDGLTDYQEGLNYMLEHLECVRHEGPPISFEVFTDELCFRLTLGEINRLIDNWGLEGFKEWVGR